MKSWFVWLTGLLLVAGCSSDGDDKDNTPTGHYIASTGTITLSVEVADGQCWRVTAFDGGSVFNQSGGADITTIGQYPNYTYQGDGFTLICTFRDANQFDATATGKLQRHFSSGDGYTDISGRYQFARFAGVLDANGDGIIDTYNK